MRMIDADELKIDYGFTWDDITPTHDEMYALIDRQPTIEPKKGKWQITDAYPHNVYCSECHKKFAQTHWAVWEDGSLPRNFCPNCGADMRGENSHERSNQQTGGD